MKRDNIFKAFTKNKYKIKICSENNEFNIFLSSALNECLVNYIKEYNNAIIFYNTYAGDNSDYLYELISKRLFNAYNRINKTKQKYNYYKSFKIKLI